MRLTPRLCRAARALVGFEQTDLASASGVSKSTIGAFEIKDEGARLTTMNNRALIEAFERAGLQFIPENGGGPGVRLRDPTGGRHSRALQADHPRVEDSE
nr:XRE family transcriptional regulator [Microvirga massiliensis]